MYTIVVRNSDTRVLYSFGPFDTIEEAQHYADDPVRRRTILNMANEPHDEMIGVATYEIGITKLISGHDISLHTPIGT